jgi:hypothetical protein
MRKVDEEKANKHMFGAIHVVAISQVVLAIQCYIIRWIYKINNDYYSYFNCLFLAIYLFNKAV